MERDVTPYVGAPTRAPRSVVGAPESVVVGVFPKSPQKGVDVSNSLHRKVRLGTAAAVVAAICCVATAGSASAGPGGSDPTASAVASATKAVREHSSAIR